MRRSQKNDQIRIKQMNDKVIWKSNKIQVQILNNKSVIKRKSNKIQKRIIMNSKD